MRAILFLSCVALCLGASAAIAGGVSVGGHIGGLTINDAENNQILFGGHLETMVTSFLGVRGDLSYRSEEEFSWEDDMDYALVSTTLPITVSANLYLPMVVLKPYATAGIGWYIQDFDFSEDLNDLGAKDGKETDVGWHAGVGADWSLAPKLNLFGEYRAIFFGDDKNFDEIEEAVEDLSFSSHQITVGVRLKLGGD